MQLTKNFHINEFRCKDGTGVPWDLVDNVKRLAKNLQALRDYINGEGRPKGVPKDVVLTISVNSGFRNESYNTLVVHGAKDSRHEKADAGDITSKYLTPKALHAVIELLIKKGIMDEGGLGLYPGFVHYDCRGTRARW